MNRVSAPVSPPSRTTASRLTASKYSSNLARLWPPSASPNSLDHSLQVRTHMASKCISPNSLDHGLQVRTHMASKCISKLARLRPLSSHSHGLQSAYLQTRTISLQVRTITASESISKFTRSRCGETVELEGRQPIINTPPHLA